MTTMPPPPPPPAAPAAAPPQQQSSGCLKWSLIGCGCVTALLVVFIAGICVVVFGAIKRSTPYRDSMRQAVSDHRVIDALGTPIRPSFIVMGSVHFDNGKGDADINYKLSGPRGTAKVHVVATRVNDAWSYTEMTVTPDTGPQIDLLH